jgi:hypothetical protein
MLFWQLPETSSGSYDTSHYGVALCVMGDVTGDKVRDFVVGQTFYGDGPTCIDLRSGRDGRLVWRIPIWSGRPESLHFAPTGDLDKDGVPDLVCSQPAMWDTRVVRVLSGLDGREILRLRDPRNGQGFGESIAAGVDFDRDGTPEVVVGAPGDAASVVSRVVVCSGRDGHVILEVLHESDRHFGRVVATSGDLDADGFPDIVTTASFAPESGCWSVLSGRDGSCIQTLLHPGIHDRAYGCIAVAPNGIFTTCIDDTGGPVDDGGFVDTFRIGTVKPVRTQPADDAFSLFGTALTVDGDLDGDGVRDVVVSGPEGQRGGWFTGEVTAYSGSTGVRLWTLYGDQPDTDLGASLASGLDMDGDGTDDVLAGATWLNGNGAPGEVWVISGKTGQLLRKISRDTP